jgi:hypothetical protein
MKKFLLIYAVGATMLLILCVVIMRHSRCELNRLSNNNEALTSEIKLYKSRLDESAASVVALQLQLKEYREQNARDARRIRDLGIRLRRVESVAKTATESRVAFSAPTRDTIVLCDTLTLFRWSDRWVNVEGAIRNGSAECRVESIDTLHQIIHRVPHKFLFVRYGTKAIRQEILSSNPHTKIVYAEYIEFPKRYKKR